MSFNYLGPYTSPSTHSESYGTRSVVNQTATPGPSFRSRTLSPSILNLVNPAPAHVHPITPGRMLTGNPPIRPPPQGLPRLGHQLASPFHQPGQWFQFPSTPAHASPLRLGQGHHYPVAPLGLPDSPSPLRYLHSASPAVLTRTLTAPNEELPPTRDPVPDPPITSHSAGEVAKDAPSTPKANPGSPASTIILTDTESEPATPILAPKAKSAPKTAKSLRRQPALSEDDFAKLLAGGPGSRARKSYTFEEDLAIATYLADPQFPVRRLQAEQKTSKGTIPQVFSSMSKDVFNKAREAGALQVRYNSLKGRFRVIEKLENATGGNGDADYALDDPEQTILEKLGLRLDRAKQRNKGHNITAAEYYAWIKDPDGMYTKLSDLLSKNVSVIRNTQFRSGAISPDLKPSTSDADDFANDILDLDPDLPTTPKPRKSKSNPGEGKVTPATGLAFLEETRVYHASRTETEKDRLALEHQQFKIELSNEARMEQRLKLEQERVAIMRNEQVHSEEVAAKAHDLEVKRLELAREHELDRKRKTDIDEMDRERTHKRLRREAATTTAVQISGDKENRFSQELRDASQAHIMLMFEQIRDLLD